jgi:hypothetical protein
MLKAITHLNAISPGLAAKPLIIETDADDIGIILFC